MTVVYTTGPVSYYRALQNVIAGIAITNTDYWQAFVPTTLSKISLAATYISTDALNLTVLGFTTPIQYSWSTPQTENFVVTPTINVSKTVTLANGKVISYKKWCRQYDRASRRAVRRIHRQMKKEFNLK